MDIVIHKDQIAELGDDLIEVLKEENRMTPEALWAIKELTHASRTREWKGKTSLKEHLRSITP